ncbi:MAG: hypothetical protein UIC64_04195 [Agathobacter sp.]|nr:hypothetical protein [Agathobacter sp.]
MKTNYIPAIIMLSAGAVNCIIGIMNHQELKEFTIQLLIVLIVFYIIGIFVKFIIDKNFQDMADITNSDESDDVYDEDTDEDTKDEILENIEEDDSEE